MVKRVSASNLYGALRLFVYGALFALAACSGAENATGQADVPTRSADVTSPEAESAGLDQKPEKLVLAFGDSLYAGYGLKQNESLPYDLEKGLRRAGINARVIGAGVSGDTTATGRERFSFALDGAKRKPDLVMIGLGGNDMLRGIQPEETRANMAAMLKELNERGIPAILTGMAAAPNLGSQYVEAFDTLYPDLAKEYNARLYPFFYQGIIDRESGVMQSGLMLPDLVHPNAKGIDVIVKNITPIVASELNNGL